MRKLWAIAAAALLLASSCIGAGANERTVLVDFSHDEFASAMFANFPGEVTVPQGATVIFKQIWTGEPHTVTGGTLADEMMVATAPLIGFFGAFGRLMASGADAPDPDDPPDVPASRFFDAAREAEDEEAGRMFIDAYENLAASAADLPSVAEAEDMSFPDLVEKIDRAADAIFGAAELPWAIEENEDGVFIAQNAGQPCYLTDGAPPKEADEACARKDQPVFDGKATYYNSGIIPYEGPQGNTYKVDLADEIEPGSYWFYCAVHGPFQATEVKVVPEGTDVPSQEAVNRQARKEIADFAEPMLKAFREARDGEISEDGETIRGPFGGLSVPTHGTINEFIPRRTVTRVGEEVTWKLMGADHTVTFDVPEYFPIVQFAEDGTVSLNPKLQPPAGGSPDIPEAERGEILRIDGGTYDGEGFFSSGLFSAEPYAEYTLRFSEPGTYRYACLLHPPMVGTVEVN